MTNNQINTINRYFDSKHMDRRQLEAVLDFDNLTMDEKYISEIRELFKSNEDEAGEDIIKGYVRFVKSRSGSGVITWDEFMTRLDGLALEYSDFGIRVQRFSKPAYWEIFFNHCDMSTRSTINDDIVLQLICCGFHDSARVKSLADSEASACRHLSR